MRSILLAGLLAALFSFFPAACSSEEYAVVTEDYSIHFAKTLPSTDDSSKTSSFIDTDGKQIVLPKNAIKQVREIR